MDHRTSNGLKFELETGTKNSRKNLVFKLEKKLESRMKNPDRRGQFVYLMHVKKKKRITLNKYLKRITLIDHVYYHKLFCYYLIRI